MRRLSLVLVAVTAAACASPSGGSGGSSGSATEPLPEVAAELAGVKVTSDEMVKAMSGQEYQMRRQLHEMRKDWLENELLERLLEREAKKENLTKEQLLERIDSAATPATDADAQMFYKAQVGMGRMKDQAGKTLAFDEVKDRIRQGLTEQKKGMERQKFFSQIMGGEQPKVNLPQPEPPQVADVSNDNDPVKGPDSAKVTVVEFSDFQCPACKSAHFQLTNLFDKYGDKIKFVYRDFPLMGKHPDALPAAVAATCAGEQGKYWEMHDQLFRAKSLKENDFKGFAKQLALDGAKFEACIKKPEHATEVMKDLEDGQKYGVNSTPTFYVNGYLVVGADVQEISRLIDRELAKNGAS